MYTTKTSTVRGKASRRRATAIFMPSSFVSSRSGRSTLSMRSTRKAGEEPARVPTTDETTMKQSSLFHPDFR